MTQSQAEVVVSWPSLGSVDSWNFHIIIVYLILIFTITIKVFSSKHGTMCIVLAV